MTEVEKLTEGISDAYSKVKLIRLHYDLLNEKISKVSQRDGGNSPNKVMVVGIKIFQTAYRFY
jgi:hypothetical protein